MVNSGIFYWIADLPVEHSNKWRERVKTQAVRNEFSILLLMATEMLPTVINDRKTDLRFFSHQRDSRPSQSIPRNNLRGVDGTRPRLCSSFTHRK